MRTRAPKDVLAEEEAGLEGALELAPQAATVRHSAATDRAKHFFHKFLLETV